MRSRAEALEVSQMARLTGNVQSEVVDKVDFMGLVAWLVGFLFLCLVWLLD